MRGQGKKEIMEKEKGGRGAQQERGLWEIMTQSISVVSGLNRNLSTLSFDIVR